MRDADVTGLILAGGQGTRMGGHDKGLTLYRNEPLVQQVAQRIAPQVARLIVNCNRNTDAYRRLGHETVHDTLANFAGPLAGIAACAGLIKTEYLFCCPCDMPHVPVDVVSRLRAAGQRVVYAHDGARAQPLICLLHVDAIAGIGPYLDAGERKVMGYLTREGAVAMHWPKQPEGAVNPFANLNTPEDLAT